MVMIQLSAWSIKFCCKYINTYIFLDRLWVVLLPFIDEERLLAAMAPVYAKLTDGEKKRNERYGKELIFFHAHMNQTHASVDNPVISLDYASLQMFGAIEYWEPCDFPLGCTVPSPAKKSKSSKNQAESIESNLTDVRDNQCLSFVFVSPPPGPHVSAILADAIVAEPVLVDPLERAISVPHLGRGNINIVDLAGPVMTAIKTRSQGNNHHHHHRMHHPEQKQMQQPRYPNHQARPYEQQNQNGWNPLRNNQMHHFNSSSQNPQHIGYNQSGEYRGKHTGGHHVSGRSGSSGYGLGFGRAKNHPPQPFRHQPPPPVYARHHHPSSASSPVGYPRHAPPPPPATSYQAERNSYDIHVVPQGNNQDQPYYRQDGNHHPPRQNAYGQTQSSGRAGSRAGYHTHNQNPRSIAHPPVVVQSSSARHTPPNMEALKMGLRNMHQQRGTYYDKPSSSSYPQQRYDR
jgi:hypothetical protein